MNNCLDSIDSRLAKVEVWEGRFIKIEDRLDSVDKQLREGAESPVRWRSPSPGSRGFACSGEGKNHYCNFWVMVFLVVRRGETERLV